MLKFIVLLLLSTITVFAQENTGGFVNAIRQVSQQSTDKEPESNLLYIRTYYASDAVDFNGRTSGFSYETIHGNGDSKCHSDSTDTFIDHEVIMGTHDVLQGISFWINDTDQDDDFMVYVYESCLPAFSAGPIRTTIHMEEPLPTSAGYYSRYVWVLESYKNRHAECKMMTRVRFGDLTNSCNQVLPSLQKFKAYIVVDDLIFANDFD